ncbi:MAG TPA: hypothetical protein VIL71_02600 [Spirillospora sp.]
MASVELRQATAEPSGTASAGRSGVAALPTIGDEFPTLGDGRAAH